MLTSAVASSGILSAERKTEMPLLLFVSVLGYYIYIYIYIYIWSRAHRSNTPIKRLFPISPSNFSVFNPQESKGDQPS